MCFLMTPNTLYYKGAKNCKFKQVYRIGIEVVILKKKLRKQEVIGMVIHNTA